ncbi:MAG: Wzz/FepE/Etk N-terminal domain-containing protein, partial [Bacteroidota bacterium]|nr:Wzz/FepE/Etk N-terminal domain-containing protein [Bacteroidota bacterium]
MTKLTEDSENSFFEDVSYKYLPYWPLFVILIIVCLTSAWIYLRYTAPVYEVSATILINEEKKGADENKMAETLDFQSSNKIVENELEVIQSRTLMDEVVTDLYLYAPISEKGKVKAKSAYTSSPVVIEMKEPEKLQEFYEIYFTYNDKNKTVLINNKAYPLDQFIATPYGNLRFTPNKRFKNPPQDPLYFSLIAQKKVSNALLNNLTVAAASKFS